MVEDYFADTHALRRNLNKLVALDVLQTFLKTHNHLRYDAGLLVGTARTHIGELLCLCHVYNKVVIVNVLTYNLSGINFLTRIDEEFSTILQLVYTVGISCSRLHGNHKPHPDSP